MKFFFTFCSPYPIPYYRFIGYFFHNEQRISSSYLVSNQFLCRAYTVRVNVDMSSESGCYIDPYSRARSDVLQWLVNRPTMSDFTSYIDRLHESNLLTRRKLRKNSKFRHSIVDPSSRASFKPHPELFLFFAIPKRLFFQPRMYFLQYAEELLINAEV